MYRPFPPFPGEFMREFQQFREHLNEILKNVMSGDVHLASDVLYPAVDVVEKEQKYIYAVELPGVKKEDVKLMVKDGTLVLEGERKEPSINDGAQKIRGEIAYGKFQRTLPLPENADVNKIRAEYKNGLLVVTVEKKEETKPRLIDVQVQ